MALIRKQVFVDVYDAATGSLLKTWSDKVNISEFSKDTNGGLGECIIELGEAIDYAGTELAVGNRVKVRVADNDVAAGTTLTVYDGYISSMEPYVGDRREGITIHVLGYHTRFAMDVLKNGLTTTISYSAQDVGTIMRDIISKFLAVNTTVPITYDETSIPNSGTTVTYSFERRTYAEAIEALRRIAPQDYIFYIGADGVVMFSQKPVTPAHSFILGKHFSSIHIRTGIEKVKNVIIIWNGEKVTSIVYRGYEDTASVAAYGRRVELVNDYGISDAATADKFASRFLGENKDPEVVVEVEIMDNTEDATKGYDIENIEPGDTCKFIGFPVDFVSRYLGDNMLIRGSSIRPAR